MTTFREGKIPGSEFPDLILESVFDLEVQRNMMEKIAGQFENCQKIENENIEKTGIGVPSPLSTLIGIKNFPGF